MAKGSPSRQLDKFILRLPEGMRDVFAASAKANNRTMNAEIVMRLQNSLNSKHSVAGMSSGDEADAHERLPKGLLGLADYIQDFADQIRKQTGKSTKQRSSKVKKGI